ncbi:hypothetical protein C0993_008137 [Termitomyces sp. T159_Od127]|nr:hypothetical protein C0993_008137 [Termitomyces sp. T159_Od127]
MGNKKTKASKRSARDASPSPPPASPSPNQPTPEPEDRAAAAEKLKEEGNASFKAGNYAEAAALYTQALEANAAEPAYLTNRAASYMALKKFRPALDDCQQAAALQSAAPAPKTLLRLARCQLALAATAAALSTVRAVLAIEQNNPAALQLRDRVHALEGHLRNLDAARKKKNWSLARLVLDQCLHAVEAEGAEVPAEWRAWRVELELAKGNWDAASVAANDALRLSPNSPDALAVRGLVLFLGGKLPQATQHVNSALRLDPGHEPARRLRARVKDVDRLKEDGNVAFKSGNYQDAVAKYSAALDLGRHTEALADTTAALALAPHSFKALRTRARLHVHLEAFDAAVADFQAAVEHAGGEGTPADVRALRAELRRAEAALKRSRAKDYYKILGVPRDAGEAEVKKAYRRESLKHHPDKGGDEERFKLVAEAYAVLSDARRRERYDLGEDEEGGEGVGGMGMGGMGGMGMSQADLASIFAQFAGAGAGPGGRGRAGHTHEFFF